MVEEGRRSHFSNPLPCPQSGFRDFRGSKRRAVYWRREYPLDFQTLEFRSDRFSNVWNYIKTRGHTLGEQNHCARIKRGDTVAFAI